MMIDSQSTGSASPTSLALHHSGEENMVRDLAAITEAIIHLQSSGRSAATGLRRIAESPEPTILNDVATDFYQSGPTDIANLVEELIAVGKIQAPPTNKWWPSAMQRLRDVDTHGYTLTDNPPRLVASYAATGTTGTAEIEAPTQQSVDDAAARLRATMSTRGRASRRRAAAQREVDAE